MSTLSSLLYNTNSHGAGCKCPNYSTLPPPTPLPVWRANPASIRNQKSDYFIRSRRSLPESPPLPLFSRSSSRPLPVPVAAPAKTHTGPYHQKGCSAPKRTPKQCITDRPGDVERAMIICMGTRRRISGLYVMLCVSGCSSLCSLMFNFSSCLCEVRSFFSCACR